MIYFTCFIRFWPKKCTMFDIFPSCRLGLLPLWNCRLGQMCFPSNTPPKCQVHMNKMFSALQQWFIKKYGVIISFIIWYKKIIISIFSYKICYLRLFIPFFYTHFRFQLVLARSGSYNSTFEVALCYFTKRPPEICVV